MTTTKQAQKARAEKLQDLAMDAVTAAMEASLNRAGQQAFRESAPTPQEAIALVDGFIAGALLTAIQTAMDARYPEQRLRQHFNEAISVMGEYRKNAEQSTAH